MSDPLLAAWRHGTFRLVTPEETLENIRPALHSAGITRCADWPLRWIVNDSPFVSRTPAHFTRRLLAS